MMFATMTIGTAMTAAILVIDALAPLLRESRRPKLYAARAFVMDMARKPFAAALEKQDQQQSKDAE
jgi:hypothetical protein